MINIPSLCFDQINIHSPLIVFVKIWMTTKDLSCNVFKEIIKVHCNFYENEKKIP